VGGVELEITKKKDTVRAKDRGDAELLRRRLNLEDD
jgi:hypothetical protein